MISPDSLFLPFAEISLRASAAVALFLLLRPWLRRFIGSEWLGVLWLLLLARLLLPFPVESPWSPMPGSHPATGMPVVRVVEMSAPHRESETASRREEPKEISTSEKGSPVNAARLLGIVWISGVLLGLGGVAIRGRQTRSLAARTFPATDVRLLGVFHTIAPELRSNVSLRMTEAVDVPTLAGMFRPQIWIPQEWLERLTPDEMRHVLLHELGHARRRDLWVQRLFALAQCLHWFNPLVWLAARCARLDREMACDAWVLARCGADEMANYGMTLMKTARWLRGPLRAKLGTIAMASGKQSLTMRVRAIGELAPVPAWRGVMGVAGIVTVLALLTTTGMGEGDAAPLQTPRVVVGPAPKFAPATPRVKVEIRYLDLTESEEERAIEELSGIRPAGFPAKDTTGMLYFRPEEYKKVVKTLSTASGLPKSEAAPFTVSLGQEGAVEVVRELRYATEYAKDDQFPYGVKPTAFDARKVGASLKVIATAGLERGNISLHFVRETLDLLGFHLFTEKGSPFVENKNAQANPLAFVLPDKPFTPVFSSQKLDTHLGIPSDSTVFLRFLLNQPKTGRAPDPKARTISWYFVTAKYTGPTGEDVAEADLPAPRTQEILTGVASPEGKRRFIRDPSAPDAGQIDVTGYPKGTEIKSPYTGKLLRVP